MRRNVGYVLEDGSEEWVDLSIGKAGQRNTREIHSKNLFVIESALHKNIRPRVVINSHEEAKEYIEMGVRDFCVGNDLGTLYRWCTLNGTKMRELLGDL